MGGAKALLFCEQKRSKKNFVALGRCRFRRYDTNERSFLLLFFSKKQFLLIVIDCAKPPFDIRDSVAGEGAGAIGGAKALLFCEQKRSKKNFVALGLCRFRRYDTNERSFLLLFFKKAVFSHLH